jgi:hypothetical protein
VARTCNRKECDLLQYPGVWPVDLVGAARCVGSGVTHRCLVILQTELTVGMVEIALDEP